MRYGTLSAPVAGAPRRSSDLIVTSVPIRQSQVMLSVFTKLYQLLDRHDRRRASLLLLLMLVTAVSEVLGVASVMPFIAVLSDPGLLESNRYLAMAYQMSGVDDRQTFLFVLGTAFLFLLLASLSLQGLGGWAQLRFSHHRTVQLSKRLVGSYLRQPYEWFLNKHSADLATAILNEVDTVVNNALVPAMQVIAQTLVTVCLVLLLVAADPVLAMSTAVVLGGGFGTIAATFRSRLRVVAAARYEQNRARFHAVQEAFGGIKEVKIGGLEADMLERFVIPSRSRAGHQIEAGLVSLIPPLLMQALLFGGLMLVLLYLTRAHSSLQSALPVIALYALAGYRLMPAINKIFSEYTKLRANETAIDSLANDLATLEGSVAQTQALSIRDAALGLREELRISDVQYAYPLADRPALNSVTIRIPAFHSVGLVGSTGSGKSTLVDVIMGLLPPQSGHIMADGQSIDGALVRRWQRSLGYVPQQIYLSDDTIAANIAFGVPANRIDSAAVENAARVASLHDFIIQDLPEGYHTRVGERGVRLSGGQRQRIGIARALYHDPDVLILDEATSALDNLTEQAVMEAVQALSRRKTIIMIAHRLSTVRDCDCIYMLDHGEVVASGTFAELVAGNARFRELSQMA